jgi:hypothetical protein
MGIGAAPSIILSFGNFLKMAEPSRLTTGFIFGCIELYTLYY